MDKLHALSYEISKLIDNFQISKESHSYYQFNLFHHIFSSPELINKLVNTINRNISLGPDLDESFKNMRLPLLKDIVQISDKSKNIIFNDITVYYVITGITSDDVLRLSSLIYTMIDSAHPYDNLFEIRPEKLNSYPFGVINLGYLKIYVINLSQAQHKENLRTILNSALDLKTQVSQSEFVVSPKFLATTESIRDGIMETLPDTLSKFAGFIDVDDLVSPMMMNFRGIKYTDVIDSTCDEILTNSLKMESLPSSGWEMILPVDQKTFDEKLSKMQFFVSQKENLQNKVLSSLDLVDLDSLTFASLFQITSNYIDTKMGFISITLGRLLNKFKDERTSYKMGKWLISQYDYIRKRGMVNLESLFRTDLVYDPLGFEAENERTLNVILENFSKENYRLKVSSNLLHLIPSNLPIINIDKLTSQEYDILIEKRHMLTLSEINYLKDKLQKPQIYCAYLIESIPTQISHLESLMIKESYDVFEKINSVPLFNSVSISVSEKINVSYLLELRSLSDACVISVKGPFLTSEQLKNLIVVFNNQDVKNKTTFLFLLLGFCQQSLSYDDSNRLTTFLLRINSSNLNYKFTIIGETALINDYSVTLSANLLKFADLKIQFPIICSLKGNMKSTIKELILMVDPKAKVYESDDILETEEVALNRKMISFFNKCGEMHNLKKTTLCHRKVYTPIVQAVNELLRNKNVARECDFVFVHNIDEALPFLPQRSLFGVSRAVPSRVVSSIRLITKGDDFNLSNLISDTISKVSALSFDLPPVLLLEILAYRLQITSSRMNDLYYKMLIEKAQEAC